MFSFGLNFGWGNKGSGGWTPARLNPLQWLSSVLSPSTAVDQTANELDANYVKSNCVSTDGTDKLDSGVVVDYSAGDIHFEYEISTTTTPASDFVLSQFSSASYDIGVQYGNATTLQVYIGSVSRLEFTVPSVSDGEWHTVEVDYTKATRTVVITVDGTPTTPQTADVPNFNTLVTTVLGIRNDDAAGIVCKLADSKLVVNGVTIFDYGMAEGSGATEYDKSGNGNHGTWSGTLATIRAGETDDSHANLIDGCSKVISFNGTDAKATVTKTLTYPITLEATFLPGSNNEIVIGAGDSGNPYYSGINFNLNAVRIVTAGAASTQEGDTQSINPDIWNTVKVELLSSSSRKLYINGALVDTQTQDVGAITFNMITAGVSPDSTPVGWFSGDISSFKIDSVEYNAKDAYSTVLPDSTGTNDATLVNTEYLYIPAIVEDVSKVLSFNGTDAEAQYTNSVIDSAWDISVIGIFNNATAQSIWSKATGPTILTDICIDVDGASGLVRGFFYSSNAAKITSVTTLQAFDGLPHTIRYVNTGTTQQLYLDGTPIGSPTTFTDTPDNDTSICNIGSRNGAAFGAHDISSVDDGTYIYYASDASGTTLPDSTGTNDAALINVDIDVVPAITGDENYFPAGTLDVTLNDITNPGGSVHNNCETLIQQKAGQILSFNGTDAYGDPSTTIDFSGDFDISGKIKRVAGVAGNIVAGSDGVGVRVLTGALTYTDETTDYAFESLDIGTWHDFRMYRDGTEVVGLVDGVETRHTASGVSREVTVFGTSTARYLEGDLYNLVIDTSTYDADDATGTTLPDSTGANPMVLTNVDIVVPSDISHTVLADNEFWSANGTTYDEKSFEDLITHLDLWDFVIAVGDSPIISDIITFGQDKEFTPNDYKNLIKWLTVQGEGGDHMVPYEVLNGGIGPGEMWYTGDSEHILLVEHVDTDTIVYLPGDTTFTYSGDIPTSAALNDSLGDCTEIDVGNTCATIGTYAFYGCSDLATVDISTSVTTIGVGAFDSCSSLTSLVIPNSVTTISDYVFYASGLVSIVIGSGVTSLGASGNTAFTYCPDLETITVDANNPSYSSLAGVLFNKDQTALFLYPIGNSVTDYTIPGSVTTIGDNAFRSGNATSITIPTSVASIGTAAFGYCINLAAFTVDANNPSYSSLAGVLFNKDQTTLTAYPGGSVVTDYTIPSSVTTIGEYSFHGGLNLTDLIIPTGVTTIGDDAFGYCVSLTSMIIPDNVTTISNNIFDGCTFTSLDSYVSRGVLNGGGASLYGSGLTTVHVRSTDESYTAGAQTIGSKSLTVIKDL